MFKKFSNCFNNQNIFKNLTNNCSFCTQTTNQCSHILENNENTLLINYLIKVYPNAGRPLISKLLRKKKIIVRNSEGVKQQLNLKLQLKLGYSVIVPKILVSPETNAPITPKASNPKVKIQPLTEEEIQEIKKAVIFEDNWIIALNKSPGLAVHAGSKIDSHIDRLLTGLKKNDTDETPKIVHRLDRHTSGVLVVAKTSESAKILSEIFSSNPVFSSNFAQKTYWACTSGSPVQKQGKIKSPLEKVNIPGKGDQVVVPEEESKNSKLAVTLFKVLHETKKFALVAFSPKTGRTHQIRVHASSILETPILGDYKYGKKTQNDNYQLIVGQNAPLLLHAKKIEFKHPFTKKQLSIEAPLPIFFQETIDILFHSNSSKLQPELNDDFDFD